MSSTTAHQHRTSLCGQDATRLRSTAPRDDARLP